MTGITNQLLFVEELEMRLIEEAVEYKRNEENKSPKYVFDLDHFNKFLKGPLLNELTKKTLFRLKSMSNEDIHKYLSASSEQFISHRPYSRENHLMYQFWQQYWHPNQEPRPHTEMGQLYHSYFLNFFNSYRKHYYRFHDALDLIIQDFQNGFIETAQNQRTEETPKFKLNTALTVAELAYLFRALYDNNLIESKNKTDIYRFVCENFSSKQKDDIQEKSFSNKFISPDYNAVDHWQEIFYNLGAKAKKDKEKISS